MFLSPISRSWWWLIPDGTKSLPEPICWLLIFEVLWHSSEIVFSCDQAALRTLLSICPSVRPSARPSIRLLHLFHCSHHRIILKFSGVITNDRCDVHAKGQGQRSKVKVTEVMTPLSRFRTITPVWSHIWRWNDAQSWCCLEEVPYCISRSSVKFQGHTAKKIIDFDQNWAFPDYNSSLNLPMAMRWRTKLEAT